MAKEETNKDNIVDLQVGNENSETTDTVEEKKISDKKKSALTKKELLEILESQAVKLEELTEEKNDVKDKYLRNLAEMDNFRKRVKKEKEDYQKYILGDFLSNLLEVYDNFERALKTAEAAKGDTSILSGIEMIFKQLNTLLQKSNVKEIEALNKTFNPNFHQALSKVEQEDVDEPTVIEVYQKGFMYHDKLLRPTLAKVSIPHKNSEVTE